MTNQERNEATLQDHTLISQGLCVYCGKSIKPRLSRTGETRFLDHFVPIYIIHTARGHHPSLSFRNYLVPSCTRCNNIVGPFFFETFIDRFDYAQAKLQELGLASLTVSWKIANNPECIRLQSITAPRELLSIIKSTDDFYGVIEYLFIAPERGADGSWDAGQSAERVLLCNGKTTFMG